MAAKSIFSWLTGINDKSRRAGQKRAPARRCRLGVESLEDRLAPAMISVTSLDNTAGDRKVTLREAIQAAETDAPVDSSTAGSGADSIDFAPVLFAITSELTIQGPTEADGLTLAGPGDPVDQDATMPMFLVAVHCLAPID